MGRHRINIMVVPSFSDKVRQYSLPIWTGKAAIIGGILLVLVILAGWGLAFTGLHHAGGYATQEAENDALRAALDQMERRVATLQEKLGTLEESEQSVRMVFGMPDIDPDERALGIGGGVDEGEWESTIGPTLLRARQLEAQIDRLLTRCDFERENYNDVFESLVGRKDQLDHTPSIIPTTGYFSRGYGMKIDPFTGVERMHRGLDIAGDMGTPVYASANGRVKVRQYQRQMGNMITINHGFGVETRYGHLSKFAVKANQKIKRGDLIGYMGNSGYSTGPHLHYEVLVNSRSVNPMKYIYDMSPPSADNSLANAN